MNLIKKRLSAFFIDMLLVIVLSISLANLSYLNPYKYQYEKTVEEYDQVYHEFETSMLDPSSSSYINPNYANDYMLENIIPLRKKVDHYNIFYSMWYLIIYFLYFVVFTYFNNGQSIGKKLFKIKIVDKQGNKPSVGNLFIRSIFNGSRLYLGLNLVVIVNMLLPLISNMQTYYYVYTMTSLISLIFEISLIGVFLAKKGSVSTHDLIAHTKVVEDK